MSLAAKNIKFAFPLQRLDQRDVASGVAVLCQIPLVELGARNKLGLNIRACIDLGAVPHVLDEEVGIRGAHGIAARGVEGGG